MIRATERRRALRIDDVEQRQLDGRHQELYQDWEAETGLEEGSVQAGGGDSRSEAARRSDPHEAGAGVPPGGRARWSSARSAKVALERFTRNRRRTRRPGPGWHCWSCWQRPTTATRRAVAAAVLRLLLAVDVAGVIAAGRREGSPERLDYRNGHRSHIPDTRPGPLQLRIPKLRSQCPAT